MSTYWPTLGFHTGRELDGHPLGGVCVGFWFSSRLHYPFDKDPGQH